MTDQEPLFEDNLQPLHPPEVNPRTARARARAAASIKLGRHPLNGLPLLTSPAGMTCGDCLRRYLKRLAGSYPKCDLGPITGGPGTDVRAAWPACNRFEAKR